MKTKFSLTPESAIKIGVKHQKRIEREDSQMPKAIRDVLSPPSTVSTMPAPPVTREIRIVRQDDTGEVVRRFDVTGQSDRAVLKIISGVLRNMDVDSFRVEDSADDKP
jgi:hypothetical protein